MRFLSDIWRWVSQGLAAWAAQQHSDLWKLLMITYFISLGSYQLIKPFCLGESHALPEDSLLANVYPCNGSILYGAWVILSNPWAFWRDLAFVRLSEKWVSKDAPGCRAGNAMFSILMCLITGLGCNAVGC
ncbi:hypothetical protein Vretimale_5914 [Volvox reticuliferus]|uniref:Uncharacterized protein n=1 Tax=Volvox reticuliferus TaxID=1737510 RepID=A0A8J4G6G4_9CHLO|nr:hypothetical protein Vretimale_5914 [Volvox reticuliferus]